MFGSVKYGANAYAKVGIETGVASASPHKLIVMLYEGAAVSLTSALMHMKAGNIADKGEAISKTIMIIDNGLRASLDKKAGGEIAENLDGLYRYMTTRLVEANLKNQPEILEEVYKLLLELKGAWDGIAETGTSAEAASQPVKAPAYDRLAPRSTSHVRA
ncbi:MAG: flagellar export chaperone FliS [Burkholderiaceae bacterium]|nr:flagellar export chaperone FliS [Burkholderiaceae bacterium]